LQENDLGSFRRVFAYPNGVRLDKAGLTWRQRIQMDLVGLDGQSTALFLKRYDRPPWYAQLQRVLFCRPAHSTAWWEWRQIRRLRRAGIATPTPVALGEKMGGWQEKRSFIALAAARGESLERWVPRHLLPPHPRIPFAQRRALLRELAGLVRRLHRAGFCHRDLYLSHVFLDLQPSAAPRLTLIDLQRVFRPRWRRRRWQIKDLAALYYSSPAAAIFREYLGRSRLRAADKRLARKVLAKARRIARHNRSRAGRLTHGAVAG
jgi:heptose I phosphotransferase